MFQTIKSVLFCSNLTKNCLNAFNLSLVLAIQNKAKLFLLHVIEKEVPTYIENEIKSAIGEEKFKKIENDYQNDVRNILIGKMSPERMIHKILEQYCEKEDQCNENYYPEYETLVVKGETSSAILSVSEEVGSDIIVLGARKGFSKNNSLGNVVKGVMRKAKKPVIFAPPQNE